MRERDSVYDRVSERVARYVKEGDCACHILKEYVLSKARERECERERECVIEIRQRKREWSKTERLCVRERVFARPLRFAQHLHFGRGAELGTV